MGKHDSNHHLSAQMTLTKFLLISAYSSILQPKTNPSRCTVFVLHSYPHESASICEM
jgi:hypothetical protein